MGDAEEAPPEGGASLGDLPVPVLWSIFERTAAAARLSPGELARLRLVCRAFRKQIADSCTGLSIPSRDHGSDVLSAYVSRLASLERVVFVADSGYTMIDTCAVLHAVLGNPSVRHVKFRGYESLSKPAAELLAGSQVHSVAWDRPGIGTLQRVAAAGKAVRLTGACFAAEVARWPTNALQNVTELGLDLAPSLSFGHVESNLRQLVTSLQAMERGGLPTPAICHLSLVATDLGSFEALLRSIPRRATVRSIAWTVDNFTAQDAATLALWFPNLEELALEWPPSPRRPHEGATGLLLFQSLTRLTRLRIKMAPRWSSPRRGPRLDCLGLALAPIAHQLQELVVEWVQGVCVAGLLQQLVIAARRHDGGLRALRVLHLHAASTCDYEGYDDLLSPKPPAMELLAELLPLLPALERLVVWSEEGRASSRGPGDLMRSAASGNLREVALSPVSATTGLDLRPLVSSSPCLERLALGFGADDMFLAKPHPQQTAFRQTTSAASVELRLAHPCRIGAARYTPTMATLTPSQLAAVLRTCAERTGGAAPPVEAAELRLQGWLLGPLNGPEGQQEQQRQQEQQKQQGVRECQELAKLLARVGSCSLFFELKHGTPSIPIGPMLRALLPPLAQRLTRLTVHHSDGDKDRPPPLNEDVVDCLFECSPFPCLEKLDIARCTIRGHEQLKTLAFMDAPRLSVLSLNVGDFVDEAAERLMEGLAARSQPVDSRGEPTSLTVRLQSAFARFLLESRSADWLERQAKVCSWVRLAA